MRSQPETGLPGGAEQADQEFRNLLSVLSKTNLVTEGGPAVSVRAVQSRVEEARIASQNDQLDRSSVWIIQAWKDFDEVARQWELLVREIEDRAKQDVSVVKWRRIQGFHNKKRPSIRHTETAFQRLRDALALLNEERERRRQGHQALASNDAGQGEPADKAAAAAPPTLHLNAPLPPGFLKAFRWAARQIGSKASRAEVVTQYFAVEARLEVASHSDSEDAFDMFVPFPETDQLFFLAKTTQIVQMRRPTEGKVVQVHDPETGQNEAMVPADLKSHIQGGVWLLAAKT